MTAGSGVGDGPQLGGAAAGAPHPGAAGGGGGDQPGCGGAAIAGGPGGGAAIAGGPGGGAAIAGGPGGGAAIGGGPGDRVGGGETSAWPLATPTGAGAGPTTVADEPPAATAAVGDDAVPDDAVPDEAGTAVAVPDDVAPDDAVELDAVDDDAVADPARPGATVGVDSASIGKAGVAATGTAIGDGAGDHVGVAHAPGCGGGRGAGSTGKTGTAIGAVTAASSAGRGAAAIAATGRGVAEPRLIASERWAGGGATGGGGSASGSTSKPRLPSGKAEITSVTGSPPSVSPVSASRGIRTVAVAPPIDSIGARRSGAVRSPGGRVGATPCRVGSARASRRSSAIARGGGAARSANRGAATPSKVGAESRRRRLASGADDAGRTGGAGTIGGAGGGGSAIGGASVVGAPDADGAGGRLGGADAPALDGPALDAPALDAPAFGGSAFGGPGGRGAGVGTVRDGGIGAGVGTVTDGPCAALGAPETCGAVWGRPRKVGKAGIARLTTSAGLPRGSTVHWARDGSPLALAGSPAGAPRGTRCRGTAAAGARPRCSATKVMSPRLRTSRRTNRTAVLPSAADSSASPSRITARLAKVMTTRQGPAASGGASRAGMVTTSPDTRAQNTRTNSARFAHLVTRRSAGLATTALV
jgi:hypothetical protein